MFTSFMSLEESRLKVWDVLLDVCSDAVKVLQFNFQLCVKAEKAADKYTLCF